MTCRIQELEQLHVKIASESQITDDSYQEILMLKKNLEEQLERKHIDTLELRDTLGKTQKENILLQSMVKEQLANFTNSQDEIAVLRKEVHKHKISFDQIASLHLNGEKKNTSDALSTLSTRDATINDLASENDIAAEYLKQKRRHAQKKPTVIMAIGKKKTLVGSRIC